MGRRNRKVARKLALSLIVFAVAAVAAELALRSFAPVQYRQPPAPLPHDAWRELVHRPSEVPGLAYELAPNRERATHTGHVRTNSHGMRDDEPLTGPDAPRFRAVAIGDSFTFGFGVEVEQTWAHVLERRLEELFGAGRAEVLNFGVGGYSTRDEAAVLEHKALRWNPDLIVLGYFFNDPEIDPKQPLHAYYQETRWWQHYHVLRLVAQAWRNLQVEWRGGGDYFRYLHYPGSDKWRSVVRGFERMARLAEDHEVPIVMLVFPIAEGDPWEEYPYHDLHLQVARAARANGIDVLDLLERFSTHPCPDLMVSPSNRHPSPLGHEIAAEAVVEWMRAHERRIRDVPGTRAGR